MSKRLTAIYQSDIIMVQRLREGNLEGVKNGTNV